MKHILTGFLVGFLIGAALKGFGDTRRFSVDVIDMQSGMQSLPAAARAGVRTLRRKLPYRFRLRSFRKAADVASEDLVLGPRVAHYERKFSARGLRSITVLAYRTRHSNDYGVARVCSAGNRIAFIAINEQTPILRAKFFIAHEIGHTLGAWHHQPLLPQVEGEPRATIMYPYWDRWFDLLSQGRAVWNFHASSRRQVKTCLNVLGTTIKNPMVIEDGKV